jgi:hypothetical protein
VVSTETRARIHVILGRLIQALQYAQLSELTGRLAPAMPLATSAALGAIAEQIPIVGRNLFLRKAAGFLADAYYAIHVADGEKAASNADKADGLITSFLSPGSRST